jgi:hypothetical protein
MLETSQERIKLLRAGFTSKTIEKLYIEGNNFKLVRFPFIVDFDALDIGRKSVIPEQPFSNTNNKC